ncbi:MAG: hypothetical protein H7240_11865 [Glaciimonas sp.]|nr:hypothetical protein [Glaciimonas sp.]
MIDPTTILKFSATNPSKKLKAYGFLIGVMTGLCQGNVLGLKAEDLFPDSEIPHYRVLDNVVSGRASQGLHEQRLLEDFFFRF